MLNTVLKAISSLSFASASSLQLSTPTHVRCLIDLISLFAAHRPSLLSYLTAILSRGLLLRVLRRRSSCNLLAGEINLPCWYYVFLKHVFVYPGLAFTSLSVCILSLYFKDFFDRGPCIRFIRLCSLDQTRSWSCVDFCNLNITSAVFSLF